MDHRVSKDMISSGMTPSGEKTQADLGKTQYGSAPSPNKLMDAYHSMYQDQKEETVDEMAGAIDPLKLGASKLTAAQKLANKELKKKAGMSGKGRKINVQRRNQKMDERGLNKPKNTESDQSEPDQKGTSKGFGDSFDLLAAYQSMYIDSFEEGKIPAGLQAYLDKKKGKKKDDDDNGDEKKGKKGKKSKGDKPDFLDLDKDGDKKEPMKKASKEMKEGVMTVAGGAYGAKKDGLKGAVVGGTAGAMLDSMNKPKKPKVKTEEVQQVDEVLGLAAGALGAMKGAAAGKAVGALAGKAAMKTAVKSGLTKTAAGKTAAKMGARAAAMKAGVPAAISKGASGALNYGTAGSIVGSALGGIKNTMTQPMQKRNNQTGTLSADVDLFDLIKGTLLDEGLSEKEVREIMISLTPEEINEVIQLDEITGSLLMRASKAADKARGVAAAAGDKALAAKKAAQSSKFYKAGAKKNIASTDYSKPLNPQRTDYPMGKGASYQQKPGM